MEVGPGKGDLEKVVRHIFCLVLVTHESQTCNPGKSVLLARVHSTWLDSCLDSWTIKQQQAKSEQSLLCSGDLREKEGQFTAFTAGFRIAVPCLVKTDLESLALRLQRERDREIDRMVEWTGHAFVYRGVSKSRGTPKWMVYNGKPLLKWMIWGYPYFLETPISMPVFNRSRFVSAFETWHSGSYREHRTDKDQRLQLFKASCIYSRSDVWLSDFDWKNCREKHRKWHLLILKNKVLMQPTWKQDCLLKATYVRNPSASSQCNWWMAPWDDLTRCYAGTAGTPAQLYARPCRALWCCWESWHSQNFQILWDL